MITCNICGVVKNDGRQMHGHMMKCHPDEYAAVEHDLEELTEGYERGSHKKAMRPAGFRLLNKKDPDELEAYEEGYRYYDPKTSIAYTIDEVKKEGWL